MSRLPIVATVVAALVVVIGGGMFLSRYGPGFVGGPSPSPSASASPVASAADAPPVTLQTTWVGAPRTIAGLIPTHRYRFDLSATHLSFPFDDRTIAPPMSLSSARAPARASWKLIALGRVTGCKTGDAGIYSWSLSPGGVHLTLNAVSDTCPSRLAALIGDWVRVACTDVADGCYGDLEAGTFASQYFTPKLPLGGTWNPDFGAMTYTVPAGWSNSADWPTTFSLTPTADYANTGQTGRRPRHPWDLPILSSRPRNPTRVRPEQPHVHGSVDELIGWITKRTVSWSARRRRSPSTVTRARSTPTVVDQPGSRRARATAPGADRPVSSGKPIPSRLGTGGCRPRTLAPGPPRPRRWQNGRHHHRRPSSKPSRFDDLVAKAMPIVESFKFR